MSTIHRAYSLLTVKAVDDDERVIQGVATTPEPDRLGDIVEPDGAEFRLPLPLLWQHDSRQPIGHVTDAKVSKDGISVTARIMRLEEAGQLKDRLDMAWQSIKSGLVQGLSIGFQSVERSYIDDTYAIRFIRWLWLELSVVTIPANSDASITTVRGVLNPDLAAASGRSKPTPSGVPDRPKSIQARDPA